MFNRLLRNLLWATILISLLISFYRVVHLASDRFDSHAARYFQNSHRINDRIYGSKSSPRSLLKSMLKCVNHDFKPRTLEHGDLWILENYIRADHGAIECHESVTLTTHADFTFLNNLPVLVERWKAPISIALFAPGNDFFESVNSIRYLRDCLPQSHLIRHFVTFHIFFPSQHIPFLFREVDPHQAFECSLEASYTNYPPHKIYRIKTGLLYPANVGRNIARQAALTHFVLVSDIELYPTAELVEEFFQMLVRTGYERMNNTPMGYAFPVFEIEDFVPIPNSKTELQVLFRKRYAGTFHKMFCKFCQGSRMIDEWIEKAETPSLDVFQKVKRKGELHHWEPIFIGTHDDPYYEERMSWEGQAEKMPHAYILCLLNYDFYILDNAFLVHKPGIRKRIDVRYNNQTNTFLSREILPMLRRIYGKRKGCVMFEHTETIVNFGNAQCKLNTIKIHFMLLVLLLIKSRL